MVDSSGWTSDVLFSPCPAYRLVPALMAPADLNILAHHPVESCSSQTEPTRVVATEYRGDPEQRQQQQQE